MDGLEKLKPLALLILRLTLGVIFVYHGYPKLFTQTHDTIGKFQHMGFPGYFAYLAGVIEFFGGAMLIVGLFTRIAGLFLFVEMLIALVQVHHLFSDPRAVENISNGLKRWCAAHHVAEVSSLTGSALL